MFKRSFYLFLGILLSISSGSVFIYPTYSYYIKNKFKYSLRQINLYATFINIGVWIAFCMGLIYDSYGPRISNIITFLLLFGGFFLLLLLIKASSSSLFLFLFVAFIIGQGSSLAYTNALSTNIKNFSKKNSSNLIGLIISNSAIAPSIFGSIKASINFKDITNFISFVLSYIFIIIIINIICFNRIKQKNYDQFRDKLFYEFKQKFIVYIFSYANFIAIVLFIILLFINHIFGWNLPSFFMFIVLHITFIVFILMENQKKFDDWLLTKFNLTHQRTNININNRFENIERNVDIIKKENSENYEINKSEIKKINIKEKGDINEDDENNDKKIYSESACISKIKDKFELNKKDEDDDNKKENTLNINIGHDIIRKSLEFNENINNIAEYNKNINGRISIESNKEENKDENKEENEENINKDENSLVNNKENNKENNNENNNEINEEKGNNINNNKDIKNENSNLEKSIENINNHKIKELDNNNKSIDNGEKINKSINDNNNNLKEEKLDDNNIVNYPKFSINSSNNNNNEEINNQNNYPKFSISSNNTESEENPYKEKEEEKLKFSIINKEENKKKENNNINNNRESNISEQNKYPIYDENIINNNNKEIKKETNKIFNKTEKDNNKNLTSKPINTSYNNNVTTEINFITENNNNIININNSFLPLNNTLNIFESEEKEDDNMENISRCVFLLTLFRRRQIIILFFVLVLTMGSMISNVNNIKYIVVSIDPSKDISSISLDKYPLLYFAFNSLTRIVIGSISTSLMGTDETFYILISITIIGFISQVFGFFMTKFFVYLSISLAGMTHGGIMTFVPLYCRYYFSLKNLGTVLGFLTTGNAIGSIIIATFIFPSFYHKYSTYNKNGEEICTIKKCFQYSYGINCLFIICAILLSYSLYKEDKIKKIKERKEKENIYRNNVLCSFG